MHTLRVSLVLAVAGALGLANAQTSPDIASLTEKAQAGDREAQFQLAVAFDYGRGVVKDQREAMRWYRSAAELGLPEAQNSLGSILQVEKKYEDARTWYERAAVQKHAYATNNLAYMYDMGLGVAQSRQMAHELYVQSAELVS